MRVKSQFYDSRPSLKFEPIKAATDKGEALITEFGDTGPFSLALISSLCFFTAITGADRLYCPPGYKHSFNDTSTESATNEKWTNIHRFNHAQLTIQVQTQIVVFEYTCIRLSLTTMSDSTWLALKFIKLGSKYK